MGKRSNKGRRREPVRHPIPAARLRHDRSAGRGVVDLVRGERVQQDVLIRFAREGDLPLVGELSRKAGVELEDDIAGAVRDGTAGAALTVGLRGGKDAFLREVATGFFNAQGGDQRIPFLRNTLVLVAEHPAQGVIGALIAYPPLQVMRQLLEQSRRLGVDPRQVLLMGAVGIVRVKAVAVSEVVRRQGVGAALLEQCLRVYSTCGYVTAYGQMPPTPGLDTFYRRQGFTVLDPGEGFDPWVVFGVHADVRPEPEERTFLLDGLQEYRPARRPLPLQRSASNSREPFDPGTLQVREGHLEALLERGPGDMLGVHLPALLWVKLAEGNRANACVDGCAILRHAYEQLGIAAQLHPVGVEVQDASGNRVRYATDEPHWATDTMFIGHTVLLLPELGKLVDPTIEQVPQVRALGTGPLIAAIPQNQISNFSRGDAVFGVPRGDLIIGYTPVQPAHRTVLVDAPLLVKNADRYRRAGINLATLVLDLLREPSIVDRVRQAPYPKIHALLDAIGDATIEPGGDGDTFIHLPNGAIGTVEVRLDELVLPPSLGGSVPC
jgi:GNAT superfamily N-acetyltransferase